MDGNVKKKIGKNKIEIENVNEIYKHVLDTDARIVICYGGRDSGKSYFVGGQYIPHLLCGDKYFRGVAVRKTFATHRDSCFQEVLDGVDTLEERWEAEREKCMARAEKNAKAEIGRKRKKIDKMLNEARALEEKALKSSMDGIVGNSVDDRHHGNGESGKTSGEKKSSGTKVEKVEQMVVIDEEGIYEKHMKRAGVDKVPMDVVKHKTSPLEIYHVNGNKMIFRGLDIPKKLKSLKGISHVWVEEAEDLRRNEFYELLLLLRGGENQQIVLTFNPIDEGHFSNGMFVECPADEVVETFDNGEKKVWIKYLNVKVDKEEQRIKAMCLRTTYEDNGYISTERKAAIEQLANTDPFLYEVYRMGKFGTRGGRILINVEEVDFHKAGYRFKEFDNRGYAQDFGFNHANCILAVGEKDNELYVFEELFGQGKDTAEWIAEAEKREVDKRISMVCDSAEPDRIKTWQRAGYRAVGVKKYAGSVNGQIDRLKRYKKIHINSTCKNTLGEVREWKWKQNKSGRFIDTPEGGEDDAMAALRYSCDLFYDRGAGMLKLGSGGRR